MRPSDRFVGRGQGAHRPSGLVRLEQRAVALLLGVLGLGEDARVPGIRLQERVDRARPGHTNRRSLQRRAPRMLRRPSTFVLGPSAGGPVRGSAPYRRLPVSSAAGPPSCAPPSASGGRQGSARRSRGHARKTRVWSRSTVTPGWWAGRSIAPPPGVPHTALRLPALIRYTIRAIAARIRMRKKNPFTNAPRPIARMTRRSARKKAGAWSWHTRHVQEPMIALRFVS